MNNIYLYIKQNFFFKIFITSFPLILLSKIIFQRPHNINFHKIYDNYPKPIVDYGLSRARAIETFKQVAEMQEDLSLSKMAEKLDRKDAKTYSHDEAWE
ncbi:MAG: hypothetical protein ACIPMY_03670 [Rickettsia endosymbiont of Pentastiridius leporinus]